MSTASPRPILGLLLRVAGACNGSKLVYSVAWACMETQTSYYFPPCDPPGMCGHTHPFSLPIIRRLGRTSVAELFISKYNERPIPRSLPASFPLLFTSQFQSLLYTLVHTKVSFVRFRYSLFLIPPLLTSTLISTENAFHCCSRSRRCRRRHGPVLHQQRCCPQLFPGDLPEGLRPRRQLQGSLHHRTYTSCRYISAGSSCPRFRVVLGQV